MRGRTCKVDLLGGGSLGGRFERKIHTLQEKLDPKLYIYSSLNDTGSNLFSLNVF